MSSHNQIHSHRPIRVVANGAVAAFLAVGFFRALSTNFEIAALTIATTLLFTFSFYNNRLKANEVGIIGILLVLLGYTYFLSPFAGRSLVQAYFFFCSGLLFISLRQIARSAIIGSSEHSMLDYGKSAFLIMTLFHSLACIALYLENPIRVTGLMEDYSQASLLILFAFILSYPKLKQKSYFTSVCVILFLGFFATFSRTSNTILIVSLLALIWFEAKHGRLQSLLKPLITIAFALTAIYSYPVLVNQDAVDRGGVRDISTLNSRTIYWESAWNAIQEKPLTGHGLGNFEWTGIKESRPFKAIHHVHNDYLQVWHDLGLIWLIPLLLLFIRLIVVTGPLRLWPPKHLFQCRQLNEQQFCAWIALSGLAMYMTINFALYSLPLQVAVVLAIIDATTSNE